MWPAGIGPAAGRSSVLFRNVRSQSPLLGVGKFGVQGLSILSRGLPRIARAEISSLIIQPTVVPIGMRLWPVLEVCRIPGPYLMIFPMAAGFVSAAVRLLLNAAIQARFLKSEVVQIIIETMIMTDTVRMGRYSACACLKILTIPLWEVIATIPTVRSIRGRSKRATVWTMTATGTTMRILMGIMIPIRPAGRGQRTGVRLLRIAMTGMIRFIPGHRSCAMEKITTATRRLTAGHRVFRPARMTTAMTIAMRAWVEMIVMTITIPFILKYRRYVETELMMTVMGLRIRHAP